MKISKPDKSDWDLMTVILDKYAEVAKNFANYDDSTQERIIHDCRRDLSSILLFLEKKESIYEAHKQVSIKWKTMDVTRKVVVPTRYYSQYAPQIVATIHSRPSKKFSSIIRIGQ